MYLWYGVYAYMGGWMVCVSLCVCVLKELFLIFTDSMLSLKFTVRHTSPGKQSSFDDP